MTRSTPLFVFKEALDKLKAGNQHLSCNIIGRLNLDIQ